MGAGGLNAAVLDAGPLIHLREVDALELLNVFDALHLSDAIWDETVGQGRLNPDDVMALVGLVRHPLADPVPFDQFVQAHGIGHLHAGELEAMQLAGALGIPILLTDDLAVRDAARQLGLTAVGSLGVIVRAYRLGRMSLAEAEGRLRDLHHNSTLFVTQAVVDLAIRELRQRRGGT